MPTTTFFFRVDPSLRYLFNSLY